jgi:hypothetical protein
MLRVANLGKRAWFPNLRNGTGRGWIGPDIDRVCVIGRSVSRRSLYELFGYRVTWESK